MHNNNTEGCSFGSVYYSWSGYVCSSCLQEYTEYGFALHEKVSAQAIYFTSTSSILGLSHDLPFGYSRVASSSGCSQVLLGNLQIAYSADNCAMVGDIKSPDVAVAGNIQYWIFWPSTLIMLVPFGDAHRWAEVITMYRDFNSEPCSRNLRDNCRDD